MICRLDVVKRRNRLQKTKERKEGEERKSVVEKGETDSIVQGEALRCKKRILVSLEDWLKCYKLMRLLRNICRISLFSVL